MKKTSRWLLIALVLLPGCPSREVRPVPPSPDHSFPVRVTEDFGLADLAQVDAMLDQPVGMGDLNERGGHGLALERGRDDKGGVEEARPTTGREYLQLLAEGYCANNTFSMTMESFFIRQAVSLVHLSYARPSAVSHLADIRLDQIDPGSLPATLFHWGELPDSLPISTLSDLDPGSEVDSASSHHLSITSQSGWHRYELIGWGDFNWDGIEDILVYHSFRVVDGTMRWYDHCILTRTSPDGDLVGDTWAKDSRGRWRIETFGGQERRLRQTQAQRRLCGIVESPGPANE